MQSNIENVRGGLQEIQQQKNTVNAQLAEIEKRYGETVASLRVLEGKISQKNKKLDGVRLEAQALRDQLALHNKELSGQVRAAYAMGRKEKLKLLLSQQDPGLSSRMVVYYNYLNAERLAKLAKIQNELSKLSSLDKQEREETELLAQNIKQKKAEQADLISVRKQRGELLLQLSKDFSTNEQQLNRLKEGENKLKSLITSWRNTGVDGDETSEREQESVDSSADESNEDQSGVTETFAESKEFAALKGKLPWPAKGRSMQRFGGNDEGTITDGVLIDAQEGSEIHAVTGGTVAYADWLKGYGLLIIVNHGNGYMTLYAFNQSLYKKMGDPVSAGEVIASVGQSGGRSQSGLYFGIRKNGHPINPIEWCRK